jgi:hypothetical protein
MALATAAGLRIAHRPHNSWSGRARTAGGDPQSGRRQGDRAPRGRRQDESNRDSDRRTGASSARCWRGLNLSSACRAIFVLLGGGAPLTGSSPSWSPRCVDQDSREEVGQCLVSVQCEETRDVLIRADDDHASRLAVHASQREDVIAVRVRAEHLLVELTGSCPPRRFAIVELWPLGRSPSGSTAIFQAPSRPQADCPLRVERASPGIGRRSRSPNEGLLGHFRLERPKG